MTFDTLGLRARFLGRSLLAAWPVPPNPLLARIPRPARLILDLGRCWNGEPVGDALPQAYWRRLLLGAVEWLGPVPVTFLSRSASLPDMLPEVLRYAGRLGCPTALFGTDGGIDRDLALRLVDCGLRRACLVLGGVTPDLHAEVAGLPLTATTAAVEALVAARDERCSGLDVVVVFPCTPGATSDLLGVEGWARQVGADGFAVTPPFRAPTEPAVLSVEVAARLRALGASQDRFHRTPSGTEDAVRRVFTAGDGGPGEPGSSRCPVAGLRLDVRACGRFGACPFQRSIGRLDDGAAVPGAWAAGGEHFEAIRTCGRRCRHPELVPPGLRWPWEP